MIKESEERLLRFIDKAELVRLGYRKVLFRHQINTNPFFRYLNNTGVICLEIKVV